MEVLNGEIENGQTTFSEIENGQTTFGRGFSNTAKIDQFKPGQQALPDIEFILQFV